LARAERVARSVPRPSAAGAGPRTSREIRRRTLPTSTSFASAAVQRRPKSARGVPALRPRSPHPAWGRV